MLSANRRELYLSALRPPAGYELNWAIATTYSLDLMTLLTMPLSFALLDLTEDDGKPLSDPVALLHALRKYADRLIVFCQAGRIAVPLKRHLLYAHLEHIIVPVSAPKASEGGAFHPKVWVLRFTAPGEVVRYRFLCLSRNITDDPSWDTLLSLDGEVVERQRAFAKNHPLADFIAALPKLTAHGLADAQVRVLGTMDDELRRVRFDLPEPFEDYAFLPMGLPGFRPAQVPEDARRLMILSPFVSQSFLKEAAEAIDAILISREESLYDIEASVLNKFRKVYAMIDAATGDNDGADISNAPARAPRDEAAGVETARGLHAKLYIADAGWDSYVWTGSANASSAGFERNVEFLTELIGKKSKVGIDAFLDGISGTKGFAQFIAQYTPPNEPPPTDPIMEKNEKAAERLRLIIASIPLRIEVASHPEGYVLILRSDEPIELEFEATASVWPITLSPTAAQPLAPLFSGKVVEFGPVSEQALTAFLAIRVTAGSGPSQADISFALKVPLVGAPTNRFENLLHHVLSNPANVLRYLLLLMHHEAGNISEVVDLLMPSKSTRSRRANGAGAVPLFEELSRALASSPRLLDAVKSLVDDLQKTPEGAALLPSDFDAVWRPIWRAREALRS